MARLRVLLLLLVALGGVICNASKSREKETKRLAKKSTNGKRESVELADPYSFGQKEEPFLPIYQFRYPEAPLKATTKNYVTAATHPQLSFNEPEAVVPMNAGPSHDPSSSKTDTGVKYTPSSYKPNSEGGLHHASSLYQGPSYAVAAPHQGPAGQARNHPGPFYSAAPVQHSSASLALPLNYGGIDQPLLQQPDQQNQYAIALSGDYMRHFQQNLAAPFPLHNAQIVQLIYAHNSGSLHTISPAALKDQQYKQGAVQYVTIAPYLAPPQGRHPLVAIPGVITHIIPYLGPSGPHHQQVQQHPPAGFHYGAYNHQVPPNSVAFTAALPHQQQSIQKQQIYGPIQATVVGTAAATVPVALKPVQQQQQLQHQNFAHFYQDYHPGATGYTRYSQSPSGSNGSGGSSNPGEVPADETGSSSSFKQGPLYSSPSSSTNNPGSTYPRPVGSTGGKMEFAYGVDSSSEGPMYIHPGAMHYGTHIYHPSRNVVVAGSAAIAGISPPSYHPQQQSPANNSHHGSRGTSSSVLKFA